MATLPAQGGSAGTWGTQLNEFLSVSLDASGALKNLWFNVKDYGAVGNGSTNDTAAFQAAIDAADAVGGGTVFVPASTGYVLTQITMKEKVQLVGAGWRSVLTCNNNNASASMILIPATVNYCRVSRLYLNGNKANNTVANVAVSIAGGSGNPNHMIDHCFIYSFKGRGIEVLTNGLVTRIYDNWVYGCDAEGIYAAAHDCQIFGNVLSSSGFEGIVIAGSNGKSANNKPFYSGQITAARGIGIKITGSQHMSVNDEPQDNLGDGWHLDTCYNAVLMGGSVGDNAGAAIKITGGGRHFIKTHVSGGYRTQHTSVLSVASSPAYCDIEVIYDPQTKIGANPAVAGTIPTTNLVRLNGEIVQGGMTLSAGGLTLSGSSTYGIDLNASTYSLGPIRLKNNTYLVARNAAGSADVNLFGFDTTDSINFQSAARFAQGFTVSDTKNVIFSTGTGTKIGTATTQKIGFWNVTPIVQPSGIPAAATDLATVITLANDIRVKLLALGLVA